MTAEFTKGPWYNNGGQIEHLDPETSYTQIIGAVGVVNDQSMTDTANARLIAAAPDMYEALKIIRCHAPDLLRSVVLTQQIRPFPHNGKGKTTLLDIAQAALAKAKGETE
jgi:hypothetical protein